MPKDFQRLQPKGLFFQAARGISTVCQTLLSPAINEVEVQIQFSVPLSFFYLRISIQSMVLFILFRS